MLRELSEMWWRPAARWGWWAVSGSRPRSRSASLIQGGVSQSWSDHMSVSECVPPSGWASAMPQRACVSKHIMSVWFGRVGCWGGGGFWVWCGAVQLRSEEGLELLTALVINSGKALAAAAPLTFGSFHPIQSFSCLREGEGGATLHLLANARSWVGRRLRPLWSVLEE